MARARERVPNDTPSLPQPDRWFAASGPGVAGVVRCPSLLDAGPYRGARGLRADVPGYNFARFAHQNVVWASALARTAAWVEAEDAPRGRELAAFAEPRAHAAVAALFRAGWTAAELSAHNEEHEGADEGAEGWGLENV
jgi:hypothetical protein